MALFLRGWKFAIFAITHHAFALTILRLELAPIINVIQLCTGTIRKAEKHTANTGISTMKKTQFTKSVNVPVFTHEIVRLATRGGRKSALRAGVRKRE